MVRLKTKSKQEDREKFVTEKMSSNPFDNDYDDNYTRARTRNYPREAPLTEEEKIQKIMQEIEDSESRQLDSTRRALASIDDSERVGIATAEVCINGF